MKDGSNNRLIGRNGVTPSWYEGNGWFDSGIRLLRVVFNTSKSLRFAKIETVYWKKYNAGDEPVDMQVAWFDSFEEIHNTLEAHGIENEVWWQNGDEIFSDADAFITVP